MARGLILLVLAIGLTFLLRPFLATRQALNDHGVSIPGRIYHKSETVKAIYSSWDRSRAATIEYTIPETGGVTFFDVHPNFEQYDALHTGQAVQLKYLLHRDVPDVPMAGFLWGIHALRTVRLENPPVTSELVTFFTPKVVLTCEALGGLIFLVVLWRITRSPLLGWAAVIGVVIGLGFLFLEDFPRPTPAPSVEVRSGSGRVQSISRVDKLFSGRRRRGLSADQPVDVVAVEFVPEGKTEPVVAVDLIDRGSVRGLKQQSTVAIEYERASPRTAYIQGATRTFPSRNFSGIVVQGVLCLGVLIVFLAGAHWVGKAFSR